VESITVGKPRKGGRLGAALSDTNGHGGESTRDAFLQRHFERQDLSGPLAVHRPIDSVEV
jgi:hypothetical protein